MGKLEGTTRLILSHQGIVCNISDVQDYSRPRLPDQFHKVTYNLNNQTVVARPIREPKLSWDVEFWAYEETVLLLNDILLSVTLIRPDIPQCRLTDLMSRLSDLNPATRVAAAGPIGTALPRPNGGLSYYAQFNVLITDMSLRDEIVGDAPDGTKIWACSLQLTEGDKTL